MDPFSDVVPLLGSNGLCQQAKEKEPLVEDCPLRMAKTKQPLQTTNPSLNGFWGKMACNFFLRKKC